MRASVVSVGLRTNEFTFTSHQRKLTAPTQSTKEIYRICRQLYTELWKGVPIRTVSVRLSGLSPDGTLQLDMYGNEEIRQQKLDKCIDSMRTKYGDSCLGRARTIASGADAVAVTTHKAYPKIKPNIMNGV